MFDRIVDSQGEHNSDEINFLLGFMSLDREGVYFAAWFIAESFPSLVWA